MAQGPKNFLDYEILGLELRSFPIILTRRVYLKDYCSMVGSLPNMHKALDSIPSTIHTIQKKREKEKGFTIR